MSFREESESGRVRRRIIPSHEAGFQFLYKLRLEAGLVQDVSAEDVLAKGYGTNFCPNSAGESR